MRIVTVLSSRSKSQSPLPVYTNDGNNCDDDDDDDSFHVLFSPGCGSVSWRAPRTVYVISMCTEEVLTSSELTLLSWLVVLALLPLGVASSVNRSRSTCQFLM